MAQFINTNISALNAQRNLSKSQATGMQAMQRLSSGLRINSAKDDAAGLAISDRMSSQITGQNQAVRNANDGISLVQTGDGALAEITNNLQRIRELAVQASNVVNSASDRAAIDLEVQQRLAEIDRSASQTSFNGQKLLDGSLGTANFQIGANAGEAISVAMNTDVRITGTGKVATVTSGTLGAAKTDGSVTTGTVTPTNFSLGDPLQQWGHNTLTAATHLFGNVVSAGTSGQDIVSSVNGVTDFTGAPASSGLNVQKTTVNNVTGHDFSGVGNLAQFDVTDGINTAHITLTANYSGAGGAAAMAAAIQTQLQQGGGALATATAVIDGNGNLKLTNSTTTALQVKAADVNSNAVGIVNSTGLTGNATADAQFTVDGIAVNLSANYTNTAGVATAIQTQLNGSGGNYTVSASGTGYKIVNNVIGSTAPQIVATNAGGYLQGWDATANQALTQGSPAVSANNATFQVDTFGVNLNQNYGSFDLMAAAIKSQLDTASGGTAYAVTNTNGSINITKTGSKAAVVISAPTVGVAINGFTPTAASNATAATDGFGPSAGVVGTSAASFKVDGTQVILKGNDSSNANLVSDLQTALNTAFGTGKYLAETNGAAADGFKITHVNSAAAVVITADDTSGYAGTSANAQTALIAPKTGVAGVSAGTISLTDLTINGTAMAGTYTSAQALADKINSSVGGVYASLSGGGLKLSSSSNITMGGTTDTAATGLASAATTNGSLATANTKDVASALDTIQRVDNALSTVSTLRSTFGAVQNRFESVISTLQSASENLTAARSRIQDADFAAESANMSRSQILQQAGTAILAQANQSSQGVMALLR